MKSNTYPSIWGVALKSLTVAACFTLVALSLLTATEQSANLNQSKLAKINQPLQWTSLPTY